MICVLFRYSKLGVENKTWIVSQTFSNLNEFGASVEGGSGNIVSGGGGAQMA